MNNTHVNSNDSLNNDNPKKQKKFKITPDKLAAFEGINIPYKPEIIKYAEYKVAFGLWEFSIKKSKRGDTYSVFTGIYRNGFIDFLCFHGFYKRFRPDGSHFLLRCLDNIIEEVEIVNISDFVTFYLETDATDIDFNLEGLNFQATLPHLKETIKKQCHSLFNTKFLQQLPNFENEILKDNATYCYKPFSNGILKFDANGFSTIAFKDLGNKCVWKKHIIQHDFDFTEDYKSSHFYNFIRNVSDADNDFDRFKAFATAIGYLLHNHNSPEKGQAVICYDEVITDINKPQGGSGKGLFAKALALLSNQVKIDGKKFDSNDRFCFQLISDSTQIVFFDDVKTKLGFDRFNSVLTDGWNIEKKNKDEFSIKPEDSPKVIISSNTILENEGSTRKRRQFILEFSNYYSRNIIKGNEEPIKNHHGCIFFGDDWDNYEWQMFYSFMVHCIQFYLADGLCFYEPKNVISNRLRQITNDDFAEWIVLQNIEHNKQLEIKPLYNNFKETYYPEDQFTQRKFTGFIKKYATLHNLIFIQPPASNGITYFILKKN